MAVTIEAIKFNHEPQSTTRDALGIRKNNDDEIRVPEWQRRQTGDPLTSPAAYAKSQGNNLTIAVQLRRTSTSSDGSVVVSAVGGGILGNVVQDTIVFPADRLCSEFKVFRLQGATISNVSVGKQQITWIWTLTPQGGPIAHPQTTHEIYTLLSVPKAPWGQFGSTFPGFQLPWTDVLDWACVWAAGASTEDEATAMITREVFNLGVGRPHKIEFDNHGGAGSHFTVKGDKTFKCVKFLNRLSSTDVPSLVNCTDCAVFVSSFANILGADLDQALMGSNFNTNLIKKIGLVTPARTTFNFHEVAWKPPANDSALLFDACVQIDADKPQDNDFKSPTLAIAMPFGPAGTQYHYHLVAPKSKCSPIEYSSLRRKIGGQAVRLRTLPPDIEQLVREQFDFDAWRNTRASRENIFLWQFSPHDLGSSPAGWTAQEREQFEGEDGISHVFETIWTTDRNDVALRELNYECDSRAQAHFLLLILLAEFQLPVIERVSSTTGENPPGDVAFHGPEDFVFLFARGNIVTAIQNETPALVSVAQFARDRDEDIISKPDLKSPELVEMNRFAIAADRVLVGDEIPIQFISEKPAEESLYKFFSASGEVRLRGEQLVYRVSAAGPQLITIFAFEVGQKTAWQQLKFSAEENAPRQTLHGFDPQTSKQRRNAMALEVTGCWSSIKVPVHGGPDDCNAHPANLTRDGQVQIDTFNPVTGEVRGSYKDVRDPDNPVTVALTGQVRFIGNNTHSFVFTHVDPPGTADSIIYQGQTVASDETTGHPTFVVAGQFTRQHPGQRVSGTGSGSPAGAAPRNDQSDTAIRTGQEEGIWVLTKP